MGFMDEPTVSRLAATVQASILNAEASAGVELTQAAREIAALFVVGTAFDGPSGGPIDNQIGEYGFRLAEEAIEELPQVLRELPGSTSAAFGGRRLVKTPDVWHWLATGAGQRLRFDFPYEKEP